MGKHVLKRNLTFVPLNIKPNTINDNLKSQKNKQINTIIIFYFTFDLVLNILVALYYFKMLCENCYYK